MSKRIIAVLMSAMMLVTFMPSMAFAEKTSTFERDGVVYKVEDDTAYITGVNVNFEGKFVEKIRYEGKNYRTEFRSRGFKWLSPTKIVKFPSTGLYFDMDVFKNAEKVEYFDVYQDGGIVKEPNYYSDTNGLIYECEYYDNGAVDYILKMYPPAMKNISELYIDEKCSVIDDDAFAYSEDGTEVITKIVLQNGGLNTFAAEYEDDDDSFFLNKIAHKKDGSYNLTVRLMPQNEVGSLGTFVDYVKYQQKKGNTGIKLEAPIDCIGVKDVTYANRNKTPKVYFGDTYLLTEGEDYEIGEASKPKNKLSATEYCVLLTGRNNFFLESDEEPWYDFSVVSEYSVMPNKVKSVKISGGKEKLTFKWKADKTKYGKSKNITGYEIAYENCDTLEFKCKKIKGYKKTGTTVKKLKKGSYYVKMRSYKSLGGGEYVYSPWSKEKSVKVK